MRGHRLNHRLREDAGAGEAKEEISRGDHLGQGGGGGALGKGRFLRGHLRGAAGVDEAFQVAQPDILTPDAQFHQHLKAGDASGAPTGGDDLDIGKALARNDHRVGRSGPHNNRGAVLVVVKDRDLHPLAAQAFDHKAVGGPDILKVHGTEAGLQSADDLGEFHRVGFVHLDVEAVDVGEFLEEDSFAFHHRL